MNEPRIGSHITISIYGIMLKNMFNYLAIYVFQIMLLKLLLITLNNIAIVKGFANYHFKMHVFLNYCETKFCGMTFYFSPNCPL